MSCPAVLGPGGLWCSGTALGSATWVFRASDCRFQERAFPPSSLACVHPSTAPICFLPVIKRIDYLFFWQLQSARPSGSHKTISARGGLVSGVQWSGHLGSCGWLVAAECLTSKSAHARWTHVFACDLCVLLCVSLRWSSECCNCDCFACLSACDLVC